MDGWMVEQIEASVYIALLIKLKKEFLSIKVKKQLYTYIFLPKSS